MKKNQLLLITLLLVIQIVIQIAPLYAKAETANESFLSNKAYPLWICDSLAVDSEENVYLKNGAHQLVQVYDRHGNFKYSIYIKNEGGYYIKVDDNDNLNVATIRGQFRVYVYDKKGFIIEEKPIKYSAYEEQYDNSHYLYKANGKEYTLVTYLGYISVLRNDNGNFSTIYAMEFGEWVQNFILIILFIFTATVAILVATSVIIKKERKVIERKFKFSSYYKYMLFKNKIPSNEYSKNYVEVNNKKKEIFRYIITYGIFLLIFTSNIVFLFQTGGLFDRGVEPLIRIITSFFTFILIDLIIIDFRFNTSTFIAKEKNSGTISAT